MLLRVIRGTVVDGREADFVSVCRQQAAEQGRLPGLVACIAGYRPITGADKFVLAATWETERDAVRSAGTDDSPRIVDVLAGVATIEALDVYTLIEPAFRGIVDAPGGVVRITSGRVPLAARGQMLDWLRNPPRDRATSIQRLLLGWAVGERPTPDGQAIEVIAASAWPSPLVIEAVADRRAVDMPIYAEVEDFASAFNVEQYRALPLELPDSMSDIGSRRLIAARFAARDRADSAAASLPGILSSASEAQLSVAPLGAPGAASDVPSYVLVARVAINEYTRAERLIAELGGEVILSQRETYEPGAGAIDSGSAGLGGLSAGLSTTQ